MTSTLPAPSEPVSAGIGILADSCLSASEKMTVKNGQSRRRSAFPTSPPLASPGGIFCVCYTGRIGDLDTIVRLLDALLIAT